jgi:hypothetical protein
MTLRGLVVIGLSAAALAACGGEKKPPTVGEARDFAAVCDKANEGKRVAVTGYLRLPEEIRRDILMLRLYNTDDFGGKPVGVSSDFGPRPNQVEAVSKEYKDSDLKVRLADGQVAGFRTKVRVSGDVYFPLVGQEFPCALSNPLIEWAK